MGKDAVVSINWQRLIVALLAKVLSETGSVARTSNSVTHIVALGQDMSELRRWFFAESIEELIRMIDEINNADGLGTGEVPSDVYQFVDGELAQLERQIIHEKDSLLKLMANENIDEFIEARVAQKKQDADNELHRMRAEEEKSKGWPDHIPSGKKAYVEQFFMINENRVAKALLLRAWLRIYFVDAGFDEQITRLKVDLMVQWDRSKVRVKEFTDLVNKQHYSMNTLQSFYKKLRAGILLGA